MDKKKASRKKLTNSIKRLVNRPEELLKGKKN